MSNIIWMSDIRNTLAIDGVEYIFSGRDNYLDIAIRMNCMLDAIRYRLFFPFTNERTRTLKIAKK